MEEKFFNKSPRRDLDSISIHELVVEGLSSLSVLLLRAGGYFTYVSQCLMSIFL